MEECLVASEGARGVGDVCWDVVLPQLVKDFSDGQCCEIRRGSLWFQSPVLRTGSAIVEKCRVGEVGVVYGRFFQRDEGSIRLSSAD